MMMKWCWYENDENKFVCVVSQTGVNDEVTRTVIETMPNIVIMFAIMFIYVSVMLGKRRVWIHVCVCVWLGEVMVMLVDSYTTLHHTTQHNTTTQLNSTRHHQRTVFAAVVCIDNVHCFRWTCHCCVVCWCCCLLLLLLLLFCFCCCCAVVVVVIVIVVIVVVVLVVVVVVVVVVVLLLLLFCLCYCRHCGYYCLVCCHCCCCYGIVIVVVSYCCHCCFLVVVVVIMIVGDWWCFHDFWWLLMVLVGWCSRYGCLGYLGIYWSSMRYDVCCCGVVGSVVELCWV